MEQQLYAKKRRQMDRSNAEARRAISDTIKLFSAWQVDVARLRVVTERHFDAAQRESILERCSAIKREVQDARVALIHGLMDAPRRVVGHSRVADVEKALDGVEAGADRIRQRLMS